MEVWSFRRDILQRKKIKVGSFLLIDAEGSGEP